MTETFRLSDSVFMYLDEVGALKHLPINMRAAMLADQCGLIFAKKQIMIKTDIMPL